MELKKVMITMIILAFSCSSAFAGGDILNSEGRTWLTAFTLIVIFMVPAGLILFYNELPSYDIFFSRLKTTVAALGITTVVWMMWGYTIAFGPDSGGIIGGLNHFFINGSISANYQDAPYSFVPVLFQMSFAVIAATLLAGFIDDRMKFSSLIMFIILWITFIYAPVAHWFWGGGWIGSMGALDFAGGVVVHINAVVTGLVLSLLRGKQSLPEKKRFSQTNIAATIVGGMFLWFGWFGITVAGQLSQGQITGSAFAAANVSVAMSSLSWIISGYLQNREFTFSGLSSGFFAGLVAITPAAGFVDTSDAMIIGMLAGVVGFAGITVLKEKFGSSNSLERYCLHGICCIWGVIATGIFANPSINECGSGLLYGNPKQLLVQMVSIMAIVLFSAFGTIIIAFLIKPIDGWSKIEVDAHRLTE